MFKMSRQVVLILAVAFGFATTGCHSIWRLFVPQDPVDTEMMAKFWDGPRVGAGMALEVSVSSPGVPPVNMSVLVDQKGEIILTYLLNDPVKCDGMTLQELKAVLVKAYADYIRNPQVTVTFGAYDGQGVSPWGTVKVMGQVGTEGPVNMPPTMDLTVTKALQLAGGMKPYGDKSAIRVTRCDRDGKQTVIKVDLNEIGQDGRFDKDIVLKAGDVLYVPETWY